MPSPADKTIPALTVTQRRWWHLFAARGGGVNFTVIMGGDTRPPEEVCVDTLPVPYSDDPDLDWPPLAAYITSFDHEPTQAEVERVWPTEANEGDEDDETLDLDEENQPNTLLTDIVPDRN